MRYEYTKLLCRENCSNTIVFLSDTTSWRSGNVILSPCWMSSPLQETSWATQQAREVEINVIFSPYLMYSRYLQETHYNQPLDALPLLHPPPPQQFFCNKSMSEGGRIGPHDHSGSKKPSPVSSQPCPGSYGLGLQKIVSPARLYWARRWFIRLICGTRLSLEGGSREKSTLDLAFNCI